MNIWNTICSDLTNEKLRQATEKDYQSKVFTHFYYLLGWYSERVEQQYQQRVGSNVQYVYPDIVFFANNEKLFVIEMKQPNHIQTKEDIEQLSSYMKLLPVQFGIYIGEHIELYYKPFDSEIPTSVLKIEFIVNSEKGKTFVELFKRENCSLEKLTEFCKLQIEKIEKENRINDYINELTSDTGKQLLIDLLSSKLYTDGYTDESVNKIIDNIEINITNKNQLQNSRKEEITIPKVIDSIEVFEYKHKNKSNLDYTRYLFNGKGNYGKGRLSLEIVKQFVQDNPNLTYNQLKHTIPLPILSFDEIQLWKQTTKDQSKNKRWFEEKDDLMVSYDRIIFAFTNQIGSGNIGKIIDFGRRQGYSIEPIK